MLFYLRVWKFLTFPLTTKVMFIVSSICSCLETWLFINHTSKYGNSEVKVFGNIKFLVEIFNNWPTNLSGANVNESLESCWYSLLTILQCTNTTSAIFKQGTFSLFLSLVILVFFFFFFDELKYGIRNKVLIFVSTLKLRHDT